MTRGFLQSQVWRDLNAEVFGRKICEVVLGGQSYRGIERTRKIGPVRFRWYQFLGIVFPESLCDDRVAALMALREELAAALPDSPGDVFVQVGFAEPFARFATTDVNDEEVIARVQGDREGWRRDAVRGRWRVSRKENMPLSTIVTPLVGGEKQVSMMHGMHRRNLRKAVQGGLVIQEASERQWVDFYRVWHSVSQLKGMRIMDEEMFVGMMRFLGAKRKVQSAKQSQGALFVAVDRNGQVVGGSVVVFVWDTIVYLYGAVSRDCPVRGAHVLVQHEIMQRGKQQGFVAFDHFGGAPTGYGDHHLRGVSVFKERFGGEKIEYVGNIDVVRNRVLYCAMRCLAN